MTDSPPKTFIRTDGRQTWEPRPINIHPEFIENADGSVLVETGKTRVICTASVEEEVPPFLQRKDQLPKHGWLTAEYGMLPGSTGRRKKRDLGGKIDGRTQEIQRLIGRSLRSVVNLEALGNHTLWIDCDVIQADGGTRTAAITGGFVALAIALDRMISEKKIDSWPIQHQLAAVSVGLKEGTALVDLKYDEDSQADVDLNVVQTSEGELVEVQGTAEHKRFRREQLDELLKLAEEGLRSHFQVQREILDDLKNAKF
ncbi:MAG: ribonuclease PH [Deltaproteobacteria bacterium]